MRTKRGVENIATGLEFDSPELIGLGPDETLGYLAAPEEARDVLIDTDHLAVLFQVEYQIEVVSRQFGFE